MDASGLGDGHGEARADGSDAQQVLIAAWADVLQRPIGSWVSCGFETVSTTDEPYVCLNFTEDFADNVVSVPM